MRTVKFGRHGESNAQAHVSMEYFPHFRKAITMRHFLKLNRMTVFVALWGAVVGTFLTVPANAVTYFDDVFLDSNWSQVQLLGQLPFGGSSTAGQEPSGGNANEYREIENIIPANREVWAYSFNDTAIYDPALCPINWIDYQEDSNILSAYYNNSGTNYGRAQVRGGIALRQKDSNTSTVRLYHYDKQYTNIPFNISDHGVWKSKSLNGLQEQDFSEWNNLTSHPDFSASGEPIQFGFVRVNTAIGGGAFTTVSGIDNWEVNVITDCPEPSAMVLMGLAMSALSVVGYRRPRSRRTSAHH